MLFITQSYSYTFFFGFIIITTSEHMLIYFIFNIKINFDYSIRLCINNFYFFVIPLREIVANYFLHYLW